MRFAYPEALWLLWLVPVVVFAQAAHALLRRRALERFAGGPAHRGRFMNQVGTHGRLARRMLRLLAVIAIVLAAARPQWGSRLETVTQTGSDVVILIDTSLSMAAKDVAPSRLGQARHTAASLVDRLAGHRVALVTFAGRAALLCPLTVDHVAAKLFLDAVEVEAASRPGTALADALRVARRTLGTDDAGTRSRAVVVLSDGEDHEGGLDEVADGLRGAGVPVYAVGCGTSRGAPIPLEDAPSGGRGYKKDGEGRVVTTRLDETVLEQLALDTGGSYHRATAAGDEVDRIAASLVGLDAHETGTVLRVRYEDRFQIPLAVAWLALIVEALVSDRRRRAAGAFEFEWEGR